MTFVCSDDRENTAFHPHGGRCCDALFCPSDNAVHVDRFYDAGIVRNGVAGTGSPDESGIRACFPQCDHFTSIAGAVGLARLALLKSARA
jgi:hypothetical protein